MSGGALRRIVEAFFRRWPFYVLLFIGSVVLGMLNVSRAVDEYTSSAAMFVDEDSFVTAQSGVQDSGFFSYLTPAQFTAQELNGLLTTDSFMDSVIEGAGVELAGNAGARDDQRRGLRRAISSFASSENLLEVTATTDNPELSTRLVQSSMDEFVQFQISIDIAESGASEEFFTDLTASLQEDLVAARRDVDNALRGVANTEELTPGQERELARLQEAEVRASERFRDALGAVEASQLAALQTETDVRQSYSIFDPPQVPVDPNGGLIDDLTVLGMFVMVGLILALIGPILSAMLNRTVLFSDDLQDGLGIGVMAVVPKQRKRLLRLDEAVVSPDFPAPPTRQTMPQGPMLQAAPQAQLPQPEAVAKPLPATSTPSPAPAAPPSPAAATPPTSAVASNNPPATPAPAAPSPEEEMSRTAWLAVTTTEFVPPKPKTTDAVGSQPPLEFLEAMLADDPKAANKSSDETPPPATDSAGPASNNDAVATAAAKTTDLPSSMAAPEATADGGATGDQTPTSSKDDDLLSGELDDSDELFDLSDLEFDPWGTDPGADEAGADDSLDDGFSITVPPVKDGDDEESDS